MFSFCNNALGFGTSYVSWNRFYLRKESKMRKKRKELFLEKFYLRKEIFTTGTLKILKAQRVPYIVKPENSKSAKR